MVCSTLLINTIAQHCCSHLSLGVLEEQLGVCTLQQRGADDLEHLLSYILVFMGSPTYMRNPHLRAGMAEALMTLLPPRSDQPSMSLLSTQSVLLVSLLCTSCRAVREYSENFGIK